MPPSRPTVFAVFSAGGLMWIGLTGLIQLSGVGRWAYSLLPGVVLAWMIALFYAASVLGLYKPDNSQGERIID